MNLHEGHRQMLGGMPCTCAPNGTCMATAITYCRYSGDQAPLELVGKSLGGVGKLDTQKATLKNTRQLKKY